MQSMNVLRWKRGMAIVSAISVCILLVILYRTVTAGEGNIFDQISGNIGIKPVKGSVINVECDAQFVTTDGSLYIPPTTTLDAMSYEQLKCLYHSFVSNIGFHCKRVVRLGNLKDGGWEVCHDLKYRPKKNCLVYSAGIAFDFSFDDQIAAKYGCEVHSFDPSMNKPDFQRSKLVFFHNIGLANFNTGPKNELKNKWNMRTAWTIKNLLGHTKRHIDVLKLDIETWEWKVLPELIKSQFLDDVTTLDLELHMTSNPSPKVWIYELGRDAYLHALKTLFDLQELGFRIFWTHRNLACYFKSKEGIERTSCQEISMVKVKQ
ncbi:methyltransferase-like protein 24 isoform X2 [Gigantopelta aegis]|uniref:methyltransferase-like protein 24 isoform X2 n=1 Tax=Gigantopelta aegis TaxID=1735272 RepID=UPI001B888BC0|nr:methyltransferase-like protein 24 isoform X2 [Gigantopelta aegis]